MSQPVTMDRTEQNSRTRYDDDLYTWAWEQARLLREAGPAEFDAQNIAEELEDVARREYDKLQSALAVLMMHMLKWDHQPERVTRSWDNSIAEQRRRFHDLIAANSGLKSKLDDILDGAYRDARGRASTETDLPRDDFPARRPYLLRDILDREFTYDPR